MGKWLLPEAASTVAVQLRFEETLDGLGMEAKVLQVTFKAVNESVRCVEAPGTHDGMNLCPYFEHLIDSTGGIASGGA